MEEGRLLALILTEQDGKATCEGLSWEAVKDTAIMPHQASWNTSKSKTELTYTTELPAESHKLCLIVVHDEISSFGTA